jgi:Tol biopolymer transport system component
MWDVASGRDLSPALGNPTRNWASCVDLSADGNVLAIGTGDLEIWDVTAKKAIKTLSHGKVGVIEAVFSPDGRTLATQTNGWAFKLWDVSTWKELISLKGYGSHVGAVAFSPDGRTLAVPRSRAPEVTLWDTSALRDGRGDGPAATLTGHSERINAVAFSPDGATLASGSDDTSIILWDLAMKHEIVTLTGHTSNVYCLAFSPDGRTLASGGNDGTVRLWNLVLHEQVAVLEGHGSGVWDVAFSPDGHTLASSSFDSTIKLWRAAREKDVQNQRSSVQVKEQR